MRKQGDFVGMRTKLFFLTEKIIIMYLLLGWIENVFWVQTTQLETRQHTEGFKVCNTA